MIMLNHAAYVNRKRAGLLDKDKETPAKQYAPEDPRSDDLPKFMGKPIDQLTTEEYAIYQNEGLR